jgi:SulP family sulfate permease
VDFKTPRTIFAYSKSDFAAMMATILVTLTLGVEPGVIAGVSLSLALFLWRASRPHAAIVGRVPGTEHFRNVLRHAVITDPRILTIRIDESLTYLNARWLEEFISEQVALHPSLQHLILMCSAVNAIDASALESVEAINLRLKDGAIDLHLSEVKGPVMDALKRSHFLHELTGKVWLSQHEAFEGLLGESVPKEENLLQ